MAKVELQPQLVEGEDQGQFDASFWGDERSTEEFSRFSWSWRVSKVDVPPPPIPMFATPEEIRNFKLAAGYVTKVEAAVYWKRSGRSYKEVYQTLWLPEKLYVPELQPNV